MLVWVLLEQMCLATKQAKSASADQVQKLQDENEQLKAKEKQLVAEMRKRGDAARAMLLAKDAELKELRMCAPKAANGSSSSIPGKLHPAFIIISSPQQT